MHTISTNRAYLVYRLWQKQMGKLWRQKILTSKRFDVKKFWRQKILRQKIVWRQQTFWRQNFFWRQNIFCTRIRNYYRHQLLAESQAGVSDSEMAAWQMGWPLKKLLTSFFFTKNFDVKKLWRQKSFEVDDSVTWDGVLCYVDCYHPLKPLFCRENAQRRRCNLTCSTASLQM